jgi:hypothetical protein
VAHAYNPNYSGGRDQKNPGSKPAQQGPIVLDTLVRKKNHYKRTGGVAQDVGPKCKSQTAKKKKKFT